MENGLLKIFQEGKQNHGSRICPNPALHAAGSILWGSKAYAIHQNVSKKIDMLLSRTSSKDNYESVCLI